MTLKDKLFGFVQPVLISEAASQSAARRLLSRFARYGTVTKCVSDQVTSSKNSLVMSIKKTLHRNCSFTQPHTLQSNRAVEVVCGDLSRCLTALLSEFKMSHPAWPNVQSVAQLALKSVTIKRFIWKSLFGVFLGKLCDVLVSALLPQVDGFKIGNVELEQAEFLLEDKRAQTSLLNTHRESRDSGDEQQSAAVKVHYFKIGV